MTTFMPLALRTRPRAIDAHSIILNGGRPVIRPVLVLDADRKSANDRRQALSRYGVAWIAIVHDVADARRFIVAEPSAAAILTARSSGTDTIDLARELHGADLPCLLLVEPALVARLEAVADLPSILPLDCPSDSLFAALDRLALGHART